MSSPSLFHKEQKMRIYKAISAVVIMTVSMSAVAATIYDKSNPNYEGSASTPQEVPKNYDPNPMNKPEDPFVDITTELVKEVQIKLDIKGYDVGEINGVLNAKTSTALSNFQQRYAIDPTGSVNRETLRKMGIAIPVKKSQTFGE